MEDDATATATATVVAADAVSKVLGDDLLVEILLRVGFPTTLVRASAVCKRWFQHASDKAFLRRFRKLNPPRLLGFYIAGFQGSPRFVPMLPQPPELAAAIRIVKGYGLCADKEWVVIRDCRNGSVFNVLCGRRRGYGPTLAVHSPLCPVRAMAIDPPLSPPQQLQHYNPLRPPIPRSFQILSREEKGGGLSYFYVLMEFAMEEGATDLTTNFTARVSMLQDGVWCMHASATTQIPNWRAGHRAVMVDNKIYMTVTLIDITVLDLTTSIFSTIQLPEGVQYYSSDFMLSRAADASSVYLIEVKEFQLRIWLHKGDSWSIVDTICLHEMCANLMMSDSTVKDTLTSYLRMNHVGDNAEFVLLQMGRFVRYLDMRCKTLSTLYEMSEDEQDRGSISIHPFMMIWPPTFPALKSDPTRNCHVKKEDTRELLDGINIGDN
uniref:Uncharacterized protein n=1 Tax=Avena sativa TaxID=4498 RepID=A0ACD5ZA34_AVESA